MDPTRWSGLIKRWQIGRWEWSSTWLWAFHWSIWGWPNVRVFFYGFIAPRRMSARGNGANVNNQNPAPTKKKQKRVHCEKSVTEDGVYYIIMLFCCCIYRENRCHPKCEWPFAVNWDIWPSLAHTQCKLGMHKRHISYPRSHSVQVSL